MNDDQMRELFGEMRDDPVPAESLARVRMAVAERVQARRRVIGLRLGWGLAAALAAAACLTVTMWRVRSAGPAPSTMPMAAAPVVAVEQSAPVETAPPAPTPRSVVRKRVRTAAAGFAKPASSVQATPIEGGASEIRIENPFDPDVVIVLIGG